MAETKKYLHNLDVENNKVMNLLLNPLTTAQRTTIGGTLGLSDEGYVCYDTDLDQQYFWDGTQWITVGGGGSVGPGVPTQIAFFNTTSSITSDSGLYWDNTNKRLGIGTTSPSYKLDVSGTGRFTNNLFADTNVYVNNYFQIDTTSTSIPSTYVGIWRRKGNGYVSFFMEDEQGAAKDKWAFVKRQGYNQVRDWYQTNSSIVNINYGWGTPNSSNYEGATLLIDPTINISNVLFTGTKVRGIYYNPTLTSLTNTTHVAFENTSGDIIHGNLSGTGTRLVTADNTGKLSATTATSGVGDMLKSVYDIDNDGIVDTAEKVMIQVLNNTGAAVTRGQIVYLKTSSSSGSTPEILLASNTSEATSSKTIGAVYDLTIANGAVGYIITNGEMHGNGSLPFNTSMYSVGDRLWLDSTPGAVTTTIPTQPNHAVFIGIVTRSQTVNGRVFYQIQNGFELQELHNVLISGLANNDGLFYENSTSLWKNKPITTVLGYTPFNLPSLTSGSVLFSNGTTIAQDNTNFFWDNTNKRLGIGTSSPSYNLDISGTGRFTGNLTTNITTTQIAYSSSGILTGSSKLYWDNTNSYFVNQGYYFLEFSLISGGGFVSRQQGTSNLLMQMGFNAQAQYGGTIGTISGNQFFVYNFQGAGGAANYYWGFNNSGENFWGSSNTLYSVRVQQPAVGNIPLAIQGQTSQTARLLTITTTSAGTVGDVISVFPNGNVGIGQTTDATYKLDVNGTTRINSTLYTTNKVFLNSQNGFVYRTTDAGIALSSSIVGIYQVGGSAGAGNQAAYFDFSNTALTFAVGNSNSRLISRTGIGIANLNNTAGSEAGDLTFLTQSGGTAMSEKMRITGAGGLTINATNTATGTTGNQTINKASGTVNIAAAGTTVTVTNSLVTASSIVFAVIRTNDATAVIKNVVPGAGSFVINLNAATTAETSIGFFVIN